MPMLATQVDDPRLPGLDGIRVQEQVVLFHEVLAGGEQLADPAAGTETRPCIAPRGVSKRPWRVRSAGPASRTTSGRCRSSRAPRAAAGPAAGHGPGWAPRGTSWAAARPGPGRPEKPGLADVAAHGLLGEALERLAPFRRPARKGGHRLRRDPLGHVPRLAGAGRRGPQPLDPPGRRNPPALGHRWVAAQRTRSGTRSSSLALDGPPGCRLAAAARRETCPRRHLAGSWVLGLGSWVLARGPPCRSFLILLEHVASSRIGTSMFSLIRSPSVHRTLCPVLSNGN